MGEYGKPFPFSPREFIQRLENAAQKVFPDVHCVFTYLQGCLAARVFWGDTGVLPCCVTFYHSRRACYRAGESDAADIWSIRFQGFELGTERRPVLDRAWIGVFFRALGLEPDPEKIAAQLRSLSEEPVKTAPITVMLETELTAEISAGTGEAEGLPYYMEAIEVFHG